VYPAILRNWTSSKRGFAKTVRGHRFRYSSAKPLAAWEAFGKIPAQASVSAELTEYFKKSSTRSQACEAGARFLAGAMHDHATIVDSAAAMRSAALCVNIGELVGALSGPRRVNRVECGCCGATVNSGWRIGKGRDLADIDKTI
jgi:hypothetical protein